MVLGVVMSLTRSQRTLKTYLASTHMASLNTSLMLIDFDGGTLSYVIHHDVCPQIVL
jgi:hypothetical protein